MTSLMTSSRIIIIDTKRATSQTSLSVSFTEVLVSFNRCALLRYLHRLIPASEPCRLPACLLQYLVSGAPILILYNITAVKLILFTEDFVRSVISRYNVKDILTGDSIVLEKIIIIIIKV